MLLFFLCSIYLTPFAWLMSLVAACSFFPVASLHELVFCLIGSSCTATFDYDPSLNMQNI